jgi:hypothetical protein
MTHPPPEEDLSSLSHPHTIHAIARVIPAALPAPEKSCITLKKLKYYIALVQQNHKDILHKNVLFSWNDNNCVTYAFAAGFVAH